MIWQIYHHPGGGQRTQAKYAGCPGINHTSQKLSFYMRGRVELLRCGIVPNRQGLSIIFSSGIISLLLLGECWIQIQNHPTSRHTQDVQKCFFGRFFFVLYNPLTKEPMLISYSYDAFLMSVASLFDHFWKGGWTDRPYIHKR